MDSVLRVKSKKISQKSQPQPTGKQLCKTWHFIFGFNKSEPIWLETTSHELSPIVRGFKYIIIFLQKSCSLNEGPIQPSYLLPHGSQAPCNLFLGLIMLGIMGHTQLHTQQRHQEVCGLAKMLLHG